MSEPLVSSNPDAYRYTSLDLRRALVDLPRGPKRVVLVLSDFLLLSMALWLALSLRLSTPYWPKTLELAALLAAAPLIGVVTFARLGLYRLVTRFISARGTVQIFVAVAVATMCWILLVFMTGQALIGVPRSVVFIYAALAAFFVWASRQFAGLMLKGLPNVRLASFNMDRRAVAIYGAGATGVQLLESLRRTRVYHPIGFIDENPSLWGQMVGGLKVYRPQKIGRMIERDNVKEVLLAMPEATHRHRQDVIKALTRFPVMVKTLPAFEDIAEGRVRINDLRALDVSDLLGRDAVPPNVELLRRSVTGKAVLITGAGGSIGSEIARQVLKLRPLRLVLLDISEPALFEIEQELTEQSATRRDKGDSVTELVAVLGSVLDSGLVRITLERHVIATVYHAAAYKHVPLVESNPAAGLVNNALGTRTLADAARASGVERFVLISTDKAVRPTNVMGASKRLAELILQAHASEARCRTVFAMVRFGNVLDSSGSVVKRFRKQIETGGPVTVTHPDVIRYFMSIPEASELVIQAGAMALGGEVFVLDMGEAVKIDQLARSMIRLMGREVLDADSPDGDIAIEYIGLRPGEKLFEELLIGTSTTATEHPRIFKCHEPHLTQAQLDTELETLETAMATANIEGMHALLARTVEGYTGKPADRTVSLADKGTLH